MSFNLFSANYTENMSLEKDYSRIFKVGFTTEIKDFSTDGCSAFPDGIIPGLSNEWLHCCINHDIDYWIGGEKKLKKRSDTLLGYCVSNAVSPLIGLSMNLGVYIGGTPSPLPWKWGYGWDYPINYDSLLQRQLLSVASKYDSVIDAVLEQRHLLTEEQISSIKIKLQVKLWELRPFVGSSKQEKVLEFQRLIDRIIELQ